MFYLDFGIFYIHFYLSIPCTLILHQFLYGNMLEFYVLNAFGEELMEDNAERAIAEACRAHNANILNYTAAPVYAKKNRKGRHQWLIEWEKEPADIKAFAKALDEDLRKLNSDYDAKRSGNIFLAEPDIVNARKGLFDDWLKSKGSHKLGGQRKVPRLSNSRDMMENLLEMNKI